VTVVYTLQEYRELLVHVEPALLITDLNLPDGNALSLLSAEPSCPTLVMTSYGDEEIAVRAMKLEVRDQYVKSDLAFREMPRTVDRALREWESLQQAQRAEVALRQSEQRFSTVFHASPVPILIAHLEAGSILDANESCCELLDFPLAELCGKPLDTVLERSLLEEVRRLQGEGRGGRVRDRESWAKTRGGQDRSVTVSLEIIEVGGAPCVLAMVFDLTERKQAEQERLELERRMLHVQKLESLGVLAGGVAHDFNNILVAIIGHADLAIGELPEGVAVRESLSAIKQAAKRAAELSQQILAYAGRGKYVLGRSRWTDIVSELTQLLQSTLSKRARLVLELSDAPSFMEGDATQLRQVAMNLITNASEALDDKDGMITVRTGQCRCDARELSRMVVGAELPSGDYCFLEVQDSGCGMDAATLARVFEPFFTTKFTGRGLGMAAVLGIVRGHAGAIEIESQPGAGTRFRVLLPLAAPAKASDPRGEVEDTWRPQGRLLLVDDEPAVRAVGSKMLERLGFQVETAADGVEAIAAYQAGRFDCVVLDLTMPTMDGAETLKRLRALDPAVRVVLSSGYTESELELRFAGLSASGFIQKPYTLMVLKRAMQAALHPDSLPSASAPQDSGGK